VSASLIGYVVGAVTNLILAHRIAFRSTARICETAPRFFAVALLGFALNWFLMWVMAEEMGVHYLLAQVGATSALLLFNYVANAIWTFGRQRRGP
jgi:putative flippase GtrA